MTNDLLRITEEFGRIYIWKILRFLNKYLLKTYPLIEDCGRCRECGRNVHDFKVPDWLWNKVWGNPGGILCYDCFANRADEIYRFKWRMSLVERWDLPNFDFLMRLEDLEEER